MDCLKSHLYLSTCLIEVANRGSTAFTNCNKHMEEIRSTSQAVKDTVSMENDIV
jgi:hypothetical protein